MARSRAVDELLSAGRAALDQLSRGRQGREQLQALEGLFTEEDIPVDALLRGVDLDQIRMLARMMDNEGSFVDVAKQVHNQARGLGVDPRHLEVLDAGAGAGLVRPVMDIYHETPIPAAFRPQDAASLSDMIREISQRRAARVLPVESLDDSLNVWRTFNYPGHGPGKRSGVLSTTYREPYDLEGYTAYRPRFRDLLTFDQPFWNMGEREAQFAADTLPTVGSM
jgi:hypothetical protein